MNCEWRESSTVAESFVTLGTAELSNTIENTTLSQAMIAFRTKSALRNNLTTYARGGRTAGPLPVRDSATNIAKIGAQLRQIYTTQSY